MLKSPSKQAIHSSLGLEELFQRLQGSTTCDVLELGTVRSGNVAFWSQFCTSIYIADLRSSLPLQDMTGEDEEAAEPDWQHILGLPEGRHFDIILAWDLLNYLDLAAVESLMRYLQRFSRQGTVLFTLIFDHNHMPEKGTVYRIVDESHLAYEYGSSEMRPCPRHQPRALACALNQFRTSNSFRLRNGIVEFLFIYDKDS